MVKAHLLLAASLFLGACTHQSAGPKKPKVSREEYARQLLAQPNHRLEPFAFDPSTTLSSRIGGCPDFLLEAYRKMDGRDDYAAYVPVRQEKAIIAGHIARLPAAMQRALHKKLIGICFIENLMGNGLTDWVVDDERQVHAVVILNPIGFRKTLSQTLSERARSVFKGDAGVVIDAGSKHRGILYSLLHEITHAYDYVAGITPFTEPAIVDVLRGGKGLNASWDVWKRFAQPRKDADYPRRDKLAFYGFSGGPHIAAQDAPLLYRGLAASPFASLYGSLTWSEDAAELFLFDHLTRKLGQPYVITLPDGEGGTLRLEPMKSPRVRGRAESIAAKINSRR